MLNSLKALFNRLLNFFFPKKTMDETTAPSWLDPQPEVENDYQGVDLRFYTKGYKITPEDKKMLVSLVQKPEFRTFEKYMDWRVNACAHRMKAFLLAGDKEKAALEAAEIEAIVKVTQDMQNFWTEVKLMDAEDEILLKEKTTKGPKPFGVDRISLNMNEAERL